MKKQDLQTAELNFKKFHAWLKSAFPVELPLQVFAKQDGEVLKISKTWSYGAVSNTEPICDLPIYPLFDPNFNPETFYKK